MRLMVGEALHSLQRKCLVKFLPQHIHIFAGDVSVAESAVYLFEPGIEIMVIAWLRAALTDEVTNIGSTFVEQERICSGPFLSPVRHFMVEREFICNIH